jgi:hypothetical protein
MLRELVRGSRTLLSSKQCGRHITSNGIVHHVCLHSPAYGGRHCKAALKLLLCSLKSPLRNRAKDYYVQEIEGSKGKELLANRPFSHMKKLPFPAK